MQGRRCAIDYGMRPMYTDDLSRKDKPIVPERGAAMPAQQTSAGNSNIQYFYAIYSDLPRSQQGQILIVLPLQQRHEDPGLY